MSRLIEQRFRCCDCYVTFRESELLYAPSPFDASDELVGCPSCKSADGFDHICDFEGCKSIVSGGHPMPDGDYVHRCWTHSPANPFSQGGKK